MFFRPSGSIFLSSIRLFKQPLKHAPAAAIIASKLGNVFDGAVSRDALIALGPVAEPGLLVHLNDPDGGRRSAVQDILRAFNTKQDTLVTQSIKDLADNNDQRRNAALEWFIKAPLLEAKRTDVARAIDGYAADKGVQGNVVKALETWGTPDNIPRLLQQMENNKLGNREIVQLLGKMKAPQGLAALAGRIGHFFDGAEARQALQNCGPMAEPYVVPYVVAQDRNLRIEACKLLALVGTPKGSLQPINNAMKIYFNDRDFMQHAQNAFVVIQNRAKG